MADIEHVGSLEPEVELFDDRLGEQLDESRRVGECGNRDPPDEKRGEEAHRCKVPSDQFGDFGPLDLDDDALSGQEACAVDLGDGGGGNRVPVELGEGRGEGTGELRLDDPAHGVEGLRGHAVTQEAELRDDLLWEDPVPR